MSNIFTEIKLDIFVQNHPRVLVFKRKAKEFKKNQYKNLSLMKCQEIVAQLNGFNSWHHFLILIKKSYQKDLDYKLIVVTKESSLDYDHILLGHDINLNNYKWQDESSFRTHQLIIGNNFHKEYEMFLIKQMIKKNKCIYICNKSINESNQIIEFAIENKREGDLRIIDFSKNFNENKYKVNFNEKFKNISAGALSELLYSIFIFNKNDKERINENIKGRIISFVSIVSLILTYLRTIKKIEIDLHVIKDCLNFNKIIELNEKNDFPDYIQKSLKEYLNIFEGFNRNIISIKEEEIKEQILIENEIKNSIDLLISSGIFNSGINIEDLFENNKKITIINFSNDENKNEVYNNFINSMLKNYIAVNLGSSIDNYYISDNSNSKSIVDEINKRKNSVIKYLFFSNMKMTNGSTVMPAQARSLSISMTFSFESFESMEDKLGQKEMLSMIINTGTQILKDDNDKEIYLAIRNKTDFSIISNNKKLLKTYNLESEKNKDYFWLLKGGHEYGGHEYQLEMN